MELHKSYRNTVKLIIEYLFHDMTLTSALCALKDVAGDFPKRVSHIAILPSTEQEAKTSGSVGLHCMDHLNL